MPQKRERDGSYRKADEVDLSSMLLIRTHYHMLVLDTKGKDPVLVKTIDFLENNLPLGMGVMKFEKKLFMFGGEKYRNFVSPPIESEVRDPLIESEVRDPLIESEVRDVYKLNPDKDWSFEINPTEVPKPMFPKINPTVGYVDDKIFVLQGTKFFRPRPDCEIYCPALHAWEALPEISSGFSPFKVYYMPKEFPTYLFVGPRVYIQFRGEEAIFCFNCNKKQWDIENATNLEDSLDKFGLSFPKGATCIYGNIIIHCMLTHTSVFYIDDSGTILCHQMLEELWDGFMEEKFTSWISLIQSGNTRLLLRDFISGLSLIDTKSRDGRMCLILLEDRDELGVYRFHLRHFKLKVKNVADATDSAAVAAAAAAAGSAAEEAAAHRAGRVAAAKAEFARAGVDNSDYAAVAAAADAIDRECDDLFRDRTTFLQVEIIKDQCFPLPKDSDIEKYSIVVLTDAFFFQD